MICISNSIEYNEYKFGSREDGVITSVRPFLTKLSNSFVMLMTSVLYMMIGVTKITNLISDVENQASSGAIDAAEKSNLILSALENVKQSQTFGLLVAMTLIALVMGVVSCIIFRKKYTLDEEEYLRITNELETKKQLHN